MYSKLAVLALVVGSAVAQTEVQPLMNSQEATEKSLKQLDKNIRKTMADVSSAADAATFNDQMVGVDGITTDTADIDGKLMGFEATFAAEIEENKVDVMREVEIINNQLDIELQAALNEITAALSTQQDFVDNEVMEQLAVAETDNADLKETTDALVARLDAHKECNQAGLVYDPESGDCTHMTFSAAQAMTKVNHRMVNGNDDRDHGYINNRHIVFTKTQDDTYIRIFYHDNFRVHGHGSWARWNVMICDQNGNGCDYCNNPARLMYWRYAYHQGQWWMNDHWSGSVAGICKSASNRDIRRGNYQLRVYMDHARYDIYTGHNQQNSFMVDEVFKY